MSDVDVEDEFGEGANWFLKRKRQSKRGSGGLLRPTEAWSGTYTQSWPDQHARRMLPGPGKHRTRRATLPDFLLKQCQKCGGDLHVEDETVGYGDYACIQCGAVYEVERVQRTRGRRLRVVLRRPGTRGD